jgi:O-antigen ligase
MMFRRDLTVDIRATCAKIAIFAWCGMAFVLPFSTALTLFFSLLAVIFSCLCLTKVTLEYLLRDKLVWLLLALFAWILLSVLWTIAPSTEVVEAVSKYRKLLLPLLVALPFLYLRISADKLLRWFLYGNLVVALLAYAAYFGAFGGGELHLGFFRIGPSEEPLVGRNRITQGAFYIFAALLFFCGFRGQKLSKILLNYGLFVALIIPPLFLLSGRTGYVLFLVAGLVGIGYFFYKRFWRELCVLVVLLIAGWMLVKTNLYYSDRVVTMGDEIESVIANAPPSGGVDIRFHFYKVGIVDSMKNLIIGSGAGSYAEVYSLSPLGLDQFQGDRIQPHSEVILQLIQGGMVALVLYFIIALLSVVRSFYFPITFLALPMLMTAFFVGSGFNSYIWDLAEGHLFAVLLGYLIVKSRPSLDSRS